MSCLRQGARETRHDRVLALTRFVVAQRLREIVGMLAPELREVRDRAVAFGAMAG